MKMKKLLATPNRVICFINKKWFQLGVATAGLFCSTLGLADTPTLGGGGLGTVMQKVQGEGTSAINLLWTLSQAVGIGIALFALMSWKKASHPEYHGKLTHGACIAMLFIGSACFFLPTLMGVGASTFLS